MATRFHSRRDVRRGRERSSERGAIAVLAAIVLTLVMGFAALGFDLSYVRLARFEMKNATDAAAHAAMMVMRETKDSTQAKAAAISVAAKNTVLGNAVTLADADIVFGIWDYDTSSFTAGSTPINAVQITGRKSDPSAADGTVNTTFARVPGKGTGGSIVMGVSSANVAQVSTGAYRTRSMMFEMDVTGSFLTASCAPDEAIAADIAFLDAMYNAGGAKDKIGLDVFVGSASGFTPLQNLQTNYAAMRSDWVGDGLSAKLSAHTRGLGVCTQSALRATQNWTCGGVAGWPNQNSLKAGFPMPNCWDGDFHYAPTTAVFGGTNIGAGIASGIAALTATAKTYEVRAIVAFTDGGPLCCEAQTGGAICPQAGPCCADATSGACTDHGTGACACSAAVKQYGIDQATLAHDTYGIDVYVLSFGANANWINYAGSLARGRGFMLNTNDKTQLDAMLTKIANAIPIALVK
jgi:Flp pilus assembly protein TadG